MACLEMSLGLYLIGRSLTGGFTEGDCKGKFEAYVCHANPILVLKGVKSG